MIIQVKVISKASQNIIIGFEEDVMKIKCTAVPEKGKANEAIITLLANFYKVPKRSITILKGKTSSRKIIEITKD